MFFSHTGTWLFPSTKISPYTDAWKLPNIKKYPHTSARQFPNTKKYPCTGSRKRLRYWLFPHTSLRKQPKKRKFPHTSIRKCLCIKKFPHTSIRKYPCIKKASPYIYEETSCGFGGVFTLSSDNNLTAVDKVDAFLEAGKGCGSLSHHAAVQIIDVGHVSVAVRQYGQPVGIIVGKVVVSSL